MKEARDIQTSSSQINNWIKSAISIRFTKIFNQKVLDTINGTIK